MNIVDGVTSLVEVIAGSRLVPLVFNICKVFFEVAVEGVSDFADIELSTFGTINNERKLYIRHLD